MKTETIIVNANKRSTVVEYATENSCWFSCTPLPCDKYEFKFKAEGHVDKVKKLTGCKVNNAYDALNQIYDRGETRIDSVIRHNIPAKGKNKLRKMIRSLSENVAVVVLNYVSQVLNGGHQQWVDNDYLLDDHEDLLIVLRLIHGPYCQKVIKNIEAVIDYTGEELQMPYDECDPEEDNLSDPFGPLDTAFYKYDKEFCQEVLDWIQETDIKVFNILQESETGSL